ncbi:MAG: hypothetical protein DCC73_13920 [Proteobacteria bacterium]|nr:MAG: hypothetical protein DCC73_13920 [Pseudomonadota bacterium]
MIAQIEFVNAPLGDDDYIISRKESARRRGISEVTHWRAERAGIIPPAVKVSAGRRGFWAKRMAALLTSQRAA